MCSIILSHERVCQGTLCYVGVFCGIFVVFCFSIHTCLHIFWVCWSSFGMFEFTFNWVCYSKFFDVLVCFHMFCSLLNVLAHDLWTQFSKCTLVEIHFIKIAEGMRRRVISLPGPGQGLLYKHRCKSFIYSLIPSLGDFTAWPSPNTKKLCCQLKKIMYGAGRGLYKSLMI